MGLYHSNLLLTSHAHMLCRVYSVNTPSCFARNPYFLLKKLELPFSSPSRLSAHFFCEILISVPLNLTPPERLIEYIGCNNGCIFDFYGVWGGGGGGGYGINKTIYNLLVKGFLSERRYSNVLKFKMFIFFRFFFISSSIIALSVSANSHNRVFRWNDKTN